MGSIKKIRGSKMKAQGGRCYYCGLPMWDKGNSAHRHGGAKVAAMHG